jgi:putative transposase
MPRCGRSRRSTPGLERANPGAASSLREGMAETLTVTRLGLHGRLRATMASTNPCESVIYIVGRPSATSSAGEAERCAWRSPAAGMLEAERQFRRVRGHRELPMLLAALRREVNPAEEAATVRAS